MADAKAAHEDWFGTVSAKFEERDDAEMLVTTGLLAESHDENVRY